MSSPQKSINWFTAASLTFSVGFFSVIQYAILSGIFDQNDHTFFSLSVSLISQSCALFAAIATAVNWRALVMGQASFDHLRKNKGVVIGCLVFGVLGGLATTGISLLLMLAAVVGVSVWCANNSAAIAKSKELSPKRFWTQFAIAMAMVCVAWFYFYSIGEFASTSKRISAPPPSIVVGFIFNTFMLFVGGVMIYMAFIVRKAQKINGAIEQWVRDFLTRGGLQLNAKNIAMAREEAKAEIDQMTANLCAKDGIEPALLAFAGSFTAPTKIAYGDTTGALGPQGAAAAVGINAAVAGLNMLSAGPLVTSLTVFFLLVGVPVLWMAIPLAYATLSNFSFYAVDKPDASEFIRGARVVRRQV